MFGAVALLIVLQRGPLSVATLPRRLKAARTDAMRAALADEVRTWFGKAILTGSETRSQDTAVVFAVESVARPEIRAASVTLKLDQIKGTNVWTGVRKMNDGEAFPYEVVAAGVEIGKGFVEVYEAERDTVPRDGVPKGTVVQMPKHTSTIFRGATRDWWVYTPPGLKAGEEAALMVFQDGQWRKDRVPVVLDNLIAKGELPKIVAVFLPPGTFADGRSNRSFEYDTLSDSYVRFLTDEILPEVEKTQKLSHDPAKRAISGSSSGGICAFTAAWQRPDQFGRVASYIGSFTNIASGPTLMAGGHNYPALIRKSDTKPIRVYLQDGRNDLDNVHGSWPLANQTMAAALAFKKYDHRFDYGNGNHSDRQERARFPSVMRWLWR